MTRPIEVTRDALRAMLGPAVLLLGTASGQAVAAQPLEDRVAAVADGQVRMSFAAREGVCGNGESIHMSSSYRDHSNHEWMRDCEPGPVLVRFTLSGGRVQRIKTYLGGHWQPGSADVVDLGAVATADAVAYLLELARTLDGETGEDAIFPTVLADSVTVWPELLSIARNRTRPSDIRESAIFWLGQEAGRKVVGGLEGFAEDPTEEEEIQKAAIFALSQLDDDQGIEALIRVARTSPSPHLRKTALFWLADSEDPRAVALFEEILAGS